VYTDVVQKKSCLLADWAKLVHPEDVEYVA